MKNTTKKNLFIILAVLVLTLAFVAVLSSCGEKPEETTEATTESTTESTTAETEKTLNVSFDDGLVCDEGSLANIAQLLDVEVVSNGVSRKVEFTVKSSNVTEDGLYVDIVVVAEGIEQTVRVPYSATEALPIRSEFVPLYDLIHKEGSKSFRVKLSANAENGDEKQAFDVGAIVNISDDGKAEFALVGTSGDETKTVALLKDGVFTLGGTSISIEKMQSIVSSLLGGIGFNAEYDYEEPTSDGESEDDQFVGEGADADTILVMASASLDMIDTIFQNDSVKNIGITFNAEDGEYYLKIDSKKLIALVTLFMSSEDAEFDINELIDAIDAQSNGAIKNGDITFELTFKSAEDGLSLECKIANTQTNVTFDVALALEISESAYDLPEKVDFEPKDVMITVPFSLPQKDFYITINAVIHTSDMFTKDGGDFVTVTVLSGENEVAEFVLNERYVYLDASALAALFSDTEEAEYTAFYKEFELDGEPATFWDVLPSLILNSLNRPTEPDEPYIPDDPDLPDDPDEDPRFANGYGVNERDGEELVFNIGATEEDLRSRLFVYTFDENDEEVEFTDYTIEDFDGSKSYCGNVRIILNEKYDTYVWVLICDIDNISELGVQVEDSVFELGYDTTTLEEYIGGNVLYTDGSIFWMSWVGGFTVTSIADESGATIEIPQEGYVFDKAGDYSLTVTRTSTGEQYTMSLHVYDPENLIPTEVRISDSVYVYPGYTEEDVRNMLDVIIIYDNYQGEYTDDFEIVGGFTYGDETIEVVCGDFSGTVSVIYMDGPGYEDPTGFDIVNLLKHLRFFDYDETDDLSGVLARVLEGAKVVYERNKDKFEAVYTVEKTENSAKVRVAINSADDNDVLALINLFIGIPTDEGWEDIDEGFILNSIGGASGGMLDMVFESITGVSLSDFVSDIYFNYDLTYGDGFSSNVGLGSGEGSDYITMGIAVKSIDAAPQTVLSETEISGAQSFDNFPMFAINFATRLLMSALQINL